MTEAELDDVVPRSSPPVTEFGADQVGERRRARAAGRFTRVRRPRPARRGPPPPRDRAVRVAKLMNRRIGYLRSARRAAPTIRNESTSARCASSTTATKCPLSRATSASIRASARAVGGWVSSARPSRAAWSSQVLGRLQRGTAADPAQVGAAVAAQGVVDQRGLADPAGSPDVDDGEAAGAGAPGAVEGGIGAAEYRRLVGGRGRARRTAGSRAPPAASRGRVEADLFGEVATWPQQRVERLGCPSAARSASARRRTVLSCNGLRSCVAVSGGTAAPGRPSATCACAYMSVSSIRSSSSRARSGASPVVGDVDECIAAPQIQGVVDYPCNLFESPSACAIPASRDHTSSRSRGPAAAVRHSPAG